MKRKLLTIVSNTYYAEKFIISSLNRFRKVADEIRKNFDLDVEIILVDDGSKDNTVSILNAEYDKKKDFKFITLTRNFGAINSHRAGVAAAKGDAVVFLASDMQDPPEAIPQLVEEWLNGNKFIYCPRQERKDPIVSKALSKIYYFIFSKISQIKDFPKSGFDLCLMDRQVVDAFLACKEKNYTPQQLIWWLGFRSLSIPIKREERAAGKSGWTFSKKLTLFIDTVVSMSYIPIRIMSVLGILIAICSIGYGSYVLYQAIFGSIAVPGWASIICVISFLLGVVMIMLGVIGEYLWRALEEAKGRPSYVIDTIFDLPSEK
jgi:polyisoprenyl-phosphate glycosyltransferase